MRMRRMSFSGAHPGSVAGSLSTMAESTRAPLRSELLGAGPVQAGQRALGVVSALRARAGALSSAQLREAAGDLVADALGKLEGRLRGPAGAARSSERMREVLERDRALAFATHAASPLAPSPASAGRADVAPVQVVSPGASSHPKAPPVPVAGICHEPIRTRTFARLLAAQGHVERALAIYTHLLDQSPDDAALREETAALRATLALPG